MKHDRATKKQAKALFAQGWSIANIAREVGATEKTVRQWRDLEGWVQTLAPEEAVEARVSWLIQKDDKTQGEWNELKRLVDLRNGMLRREQREARVRANWANARHRTKGGKSRRNDIDDIDLLTIEGPPLFAYQVDFLNDEARLRDYIKSRQIGFTYVASWEALTDGIETGRNQIFLSASKNQVGVFRDYIKLLAKQYLGLDLKGNKDKIELHKNGALWATFYFLSTNTGTAQSYHGNVYIDEACWIPQYETLRKVAGAMASQKRFRLTIFSTPSTVTHPAWLEFKRLEEAAAEGRRSSISVKTITIYDAEAGGCDLFDIEELRAEYDELAFAQLFLCQPLDDELSAFKLAELEALQVDPATWKHAAGDPVWIGYDPSRTTDSASLVVAVRLPTGKLRSFKRESFKGKSFRWQAERIREYTRNYNVQHVAIDVTGMGQAVYELVLEFFPRATAINYTHENKLALVNTMRHLVSEGRLELPLGDQFLIHSFLAIKQTTTQGGRITYKAGRTAEIGHADAFFALAHACQFEPIRRKKRRMLYS